MVILHVKHFLNNDGRLYFDEWFDELVKVMRNHFGFISAKYANDSKDITCINLFLEYESHEYLAEWRSSNDHKYITDFLHLYKLKTHTSSIYKIHKIAHTPSLSQTGEP